MADDKKIEIISRLIRQTKEGKLSWQETADPETFQVSFANSAIQLSTYTAESGNEAFVAVLNASGRVIERIDWSDLAGASRNPGEMLMELYETVRRIAVGIDTTLDDVLSELRGTNKGR